MNERDASPLDNPYIVHLYRAYNQIKSRKNLSKYVYVLRTSVTFNNGNPAAPANRRTTIEKKQLFLNLHFG